jgi:hypothetical protein
VLFPVFYCLLISRIWRTVTGYFHERSTRQLPAQSEEEPTRLRQFIDGFLDRSDPRLTLVLLSHCQLLLLHHHHNLMLMLCLLCAVFAVAV